MATHKPLQHLANLARLLSGNHAPLRSDNYKGGDRKREQFGLCALGYYARTIAQPLCEEKLVPTDMNTYWFLLPMAMETARQAACVPKVGGSI